MKTEKILLGVTVQATTALSRFRMVDFAGASAVVGKRVLGVAMTDFDVGEQAGVATHGEILVEAGAAIAAGVEVEPDANGRAVAKTTGIPSGVTRDAAAAAGEIIRILR